MHVVLSQRGKLRHGTSAGMMCKTGFPVHFWEPVLPMRALNWAASPGIWGCRRRCTGFQSQWVPFLHYEGDALSRQGTPPPLVSPELGRGKLARGRGWCRGHCAQLSPVNGLVVPRASAAGCQLGSQ